MCGILGIVDLAAPVEPASLKCALASIGHRGPDGSGIFLRDHKGVAPTPFVALGHRRLAIIDVSKAASQPMQTPDGRYVITFNGEIYNYKELRAELRALGDQFVSQSDTEVLLCAFRRWGASCLDKLNGMFAFAIWDERQRQLFIARDRFGEKPLFYSASPDGRRLIFASEVKAIFASGLVAPEVEDSALYRYVASRELEANEQTLWGSIKRLMPGTWMAFQCDSGSLTARQHKYWDIDTDRTSDLNLAQASDEFASLFADSVRLRLRSDVPVGSCLSGGLDSSSVVRQIHALGAAAGQQTFSARMDDPALDEGRFIDAVIAGTRIGSHSVVPDSASLTETFSDLCYHQEEPFPSTSIFSQLLVMRLARQAGTTVLLDGQGADELLTGYLWYVPLHCYDLARRWRFIRLLKELYGFRRHQGAAGSVSKSVLMRGMLQCPRAGTIDSPLANRDYRMWWSEQWLADCQTRHVFPRSGRCHRDELTARLYKDALGGQLQDLLRYGDRNSMACARELRQPFLDHRLAEFAFSLPSQLKIHNGESKVLLRRAMRPLLPEMIYRRQDKLGFQTPLTQWIMHDLREWTESKLAQTEEQLNGRASNLVDRFRKITSATSEWGMVRHIFNLLTIGECLTRMKTVPRDAQSFVKADYVAS